MELTLSAALAEVTEISKEEPTQRLLLRLRDAIEDGSPEQMEFAKIYLDEIESRVTAVRTSLDLHRLVT